MLPSFGYISQNLRKIGLFCFIIYGSSSINGQCFHNALVGSNVGINNLSQALSIGVLQLNAGGEVNTNFCINGTFNLDVLKDFRNVNVVVFQNSTISNTHQLQGNTVFRNSTLIGDITSSKILSSSIPPNDDFLHALCFVKSNISNFNEIKATELAPIFNHGTTYIGITKVEVNNGMLVNRNSHFVSAYIEARNRGSVWSWDGSSYKTNCFARTDPSCRAINLVDDAWLYSYNNDIYENNYMGINCENCTLVNVRKSNFINNKYGIAHLGSNHYIESEIRGNTFTAPLVIAPTAIFTNGVNGLKVYENDISLSGNGSFALNLQASRNHEVSFNPNLNSQGSFFTEIWNSFITDNPIISSVSFTNTNNLAFRNNKLKGELFHVAKSQNDNDLDFYFNKVDGSEGSTKLLQVIGGDYNKFKCNTLLDGFDGFSQVGASFGVEEILGLDLVDNQISNCTNGMYFKDVRFPPQIDKGNNFFNNTMGVRGENINTTDSYFRVRNLPSEYPLHTPPGIMTTNGALTPTEECGSHPEIGGGGTTDYCSGVQYTYNVKVVKSLFQCYYSSVPVTGRCHKNIKRALELIKRCPNLLNDRIENSQFNFIKTTDAAKMPDFYALREKTHVSYTPMNYNFPLIDALPPNA